MKQFRLVNGILWTWESSGDFIRMVKVRELLDNGRKVDIDSFAELLVEDVIAKSKKIIVNLG
jgi:hypothetical protein